MDMAAETIDHATGVTIGLHVAADIRSGDHFQAAMTMFFPMGLVCLHFANLL